MTSQVETSLKQLHIVHTTLTDVSFPSHRLSISEDSKKKSEELREKIRNYFTSPDPLADVQITNKTEGDTEHISNDVRTLIAMYRDNKFNGRAVARIFHGIQSPRYPAVIWGKCKFWRAHLQTDFNVLYQIATAEIQKLR